MAPIALIWQVSAKSVSMRERNELALIYQASSLTNSNPNPNPKRARAHLPGELPRCAQTWVALTVGVAHLPRNLVRYELPRTLPGELAHGRRPRPRGRREARAAQG
eukprot:796734-Prymnesium_polylepis.2